MFRTIVFALIIVLFGAILLPSGTAQAANFDVGCGPSGVADLIAAINSANATIADDTITMSTPNCVYTLLAADNPTVGGNGLPVVVSTASGGTLTIDGNGATIVRDSGAPSFRLFYVSTGANLTLNSVTVMGGNVAGGGGGVHNAGALTVHSSTIANNWAADAGGGIHNNGTLRLLNSTVSGNSSVSFGAGISTGSASTLTLVTNSTITANTHFGSGGGIHVHDFATGVTITNSTIVNNRADFAGGIANFGSVTIRNTIVAGNRQDFDRDDGPVTDCGGFPTYSGDYNVFGSGTGCSGGANSITVSPSQVFTTVVSQTLADNGGPTQTLALVRGGRALGAGSNTFLSEAATGVDYNGDGDLTDALDTDQRGPGYARVCGTAVDIGAYEMVCPASPYTVAAGDTVDLIFAIDCANTNGAGTDDVLDLTEGTYTLDLINNSIDGDNGLPSIVSAATAGTLTINGNGSTITRDGGAAPFRIFHVSSGANLTVDTLMVSGGAATIGGGMYNDGTLTVIHSTFASNSASSTGGGLHNSGTLTLTNSTMSANSADTGGGVHHASGSLILTNSTLASNSAGSSGGGISSGGGTLTVRNTVVAGNQAAGSASNSTADCSAIGGGDFNLYGSGTGCAIGASSVTVDPTTVMTIVLDPALAYNSGGTPSHALRGGSPAINAGSDTFLSEAATSVDYNGDGDTGDLLTTDQRGAGFPRVVSTAVDIGSFEAQVSCPAFPYTVAAGDTPDLILAIACANANGSDDVIHLTDSTYLLTHVNQNTDGDNGLPSIADAATAGTLTIDGNDATISRSSGARAFRLFHMAEGADLTFDHVTLTGGLTSSNGGVIYNGNGTLTLTNSSVSSAYAGNAGGGIYSGEGASTLTESTISNTAAGWQGGGIYSGGTLTLTNGMVTSSVAARYGGGIYNAGTAAISNSTISGSAATTPDVSQGGGIYNVGTLTLTDTAVSGNNASRGGGIYNAMTLALINSTLSNNTTIATDIHESGGGGLWNDVSAEVTASRIVNNTADFGGGVYTQGPLTMINTTVADNIARFTNGGGIYNQNALHVSNSTVAGNTAAFDAAGLYNSPFGVPAAVTNNTIVNNRADQNSGGIGNAGSLTVNNSMIAGNQAGGSSTSSFADCGGSIGGDYNLYGASTGCSTGANSVTVDPAVVFTTIIEAALANNGGATPTYLLRNGSAAIDAGSNALAIDSNGDPLATDQRGAGFDRVIDGTVDIGAIEWLPPAPDLSATKTVIGTFEVGQTVTYTVVITNNGPGVQGDNAGDEFIDVLPAALTLVNSNATGGTAVATVPTNTVTWNGSIPASGSVSITITATLNAGVAADTVVSNQGAIHYDADANGTNESSRFTDDPAVVGTTDATTFIVAATPAPDLSATKTVSGTFQVGQTVTYTVTITNSGTGAQVDNPGDEFTDVLPTELTLVNANATNGTAIATLPTNTVSWNGAIPASGSVTITITATLNAGVAAGTTVSNQGTISYDADATGTNEASRLTDDPAVVGTTDSTTFIVAATPTPDLSATKTVSGTFEVGQTVTYTVTITNSGTGAQVDNPGAEFTDVLPTELTLVNANATSGTATATIASNTVTWNGAIPASGSVTITITATLNAGVAADTAVSNQGTVSYDADANGTNEANRLTDDPAVVGTTDATTFVVAATAAPNVSATKTVSGTFAVGQTVTYTVTLTNSGTGVQADNPGDEFTDVLPGELTLVNATATSGTAVVTIPTGTVTWNGTIPAIGSVTITITADLNPGVAPDTPVSNQGTITYDADANGTNETSRQTDDPGVAGTGDATAFVVAAAHVAAIPMLDELGLLALALMLAMMAMMVMKR